MRVGFKAALLATLAIAGACTDSTNPGDGDNRPEDSLTILTLAQGTPPLVTDSVGFWAVYDDDREGRIDVVAPDEDYLKLRIREGALLRYPDGTLFGPGDSVFITVKVVDPDRLLFEFTPAGLTFSPGQPAELSLDYRFAGTGVPGDFDGDGDVDGDDDDIEINFAIWRQETVGDPFSRLQGVLEVEIDEINVDILGFTRYALAY